jgi:uncharacterized protein with NRDE domain
MCTVLLGYRLFEDAPLLIAANRDELRTRPSDIPLLLNSDPPLYGGRDRLAGGTWLLVDPRGRICTLTNRFLPGRPIGRDASRHSRGEIALDVLRAEGDAGSRTVLESLRARDYNPANIVYSSATAAWCLTLDDEAQETLTELEPGAHVITVVGADDKADAKNVWLGEQIRETAARAATPEELLTLWRELLTTHEQLGDSPQSAVCIHTPVYGTVSSELVTVRSHGVEFSHAEGFPCVTDHMPVQMRTSPAG